jgi:hypothetical protein
MNPKKELEKLHAQQKAIDAKIAAAYKASLTAPDDQKACVDWMAEMLAEPLERITYPIEVMGITNAESEVIHYGRKTVGRFVAVRPCNDEKKTYLGIYLGDIALQASARFHAQTGVLEVSHAFHNPAIWVPDLKRIVFGCESWWGVLGKPEDLVQITDKDIDNVWYVQAMKSLEAPACP